MKNSSLASKTRNNWLIDVALFVSAIAASVSGIYFLFFATGGYQGGRNPVYGITILFNRTTWDLIHAWTGIAMIIIVLFHLVLHEKWLLSAIRRTIKELVGRGPAMNARSRYNLLINAAVGLSFAITALSGVYLLFFPGGRHGVADPNIIFSRTTWDLIHTWSAVVLIIAAVIHFAIHWKWIVKVTRKIFMASPREQNTESASAAL